MKYLVTSLLFVCLFANVNAQIIGFVRDADTKHPIPFASITVKGTQLGTVSNEKGDFTLNITSLPVTLFISCLGYQPIEAKIDDTNQYLVISLKPQITQLPEVTVGNPALEIIKQTAAKAGKNIHTEYYTKVFFRRMTLEGEEPTFFAESFLDAQWQNWGLTKYNISNSRYLQNENSINYNNVAMFSMLCSGYVNNSKIISPINHKPDSLYKFIIKQTFKTNGHEIAVIKCELKDPDNTLNSAFVGDYYIDTENYTVLKTDGTISRFKMNASGPLSLKLKELRIVSQYKMDADSNTVLDYSNFTLKSTLKAGFVGIKQLTYNGQLFALDYNTPFDKSALNEVSVDKMQKEEEKFKSVAYDPEYWKNNPIIKRTDSEDAAVALLEQLKKVKGNIGKQ
ncbi:carboxypeptidase-like regulatory domain-containing protein [Mucilaginibacter agri]|uniref:CarboxypepD_reg-like domain-containing protein n=1 Tax=Mucilaginibacter agri TaxID=2695265 RepID=A0A965ZHW8_9SPHI|nr:carboxypeptidase-like regulatory domain-containing protein [Mucilaginibacter agri]NCD71403.1 hypothetical protein [Mucilaginibacter agri]